MGTCGKYDGPLLRCSRCGSVFFCSVDCQRVAWKTHKSDCARLAKLSQEHKRNIKAEKSSGVGSSSRGGASPPGAVEGGRISSDPAVAKHQEEGLQFLQEQKYSEALAAFERMKSIAQESGLVNDEGLALRLLGDVNDKLGASPDDIEDY